MSLGFWDDLWVVSLTRPYVMRLPPLLQVVDAYYDQAGALYDGGVDLFMVETIFDTLNSKAAIYALEKFFADKGVRIPVMISGTIVDNSGRTVCSLLLCALPDTLPWPGGAGLLIGGSIGFISS